jgi:hypothetical protein
MKIISRAQWKARASKGELYDVDISKRTGFVVHHSGADDDQSVKDIQSYHMNSDQLAKGGWKDIGYNFLIDKFGKIYEGVGWDKVGAHVGGKNTPNIGVCVIGNYSKSMPTLKALEALEWLYGEANDRKGSKLKLYGHGQLGKTQCPGDRFLDELRDGIIKAPPVKPTKPSTPSDEGWMDKLMAELPELNKGDKSQYVGRAQALLNTFGAGLAEDDDFGTKTDAATRKFQKAHGLKEDGRIGKNTWTKLLTGKK